jgi:neutral ceramidase
MRGRLLFLLLVVWSLSGLTAWGTPKGALRAGASRVDITPPLDALPPPYVTVLDKIYVRAIVLDNGSAISALVTVDAVNIGNEVWEEITQRITKDAGIPAENVMLTMTHAHSAPRAQRDPDAKGYTPQITSNPKTIANVTRIVDAVSLAVQQAKASLQPARVGYGTGRAYLNVNRDWFNPKDNRYYLYHPSMGTNYDAPSDKTVAVVRFETLSGELIALYSNYSVHGVVNNGGGGTEISGDLPGSASRFIEERYHGKVVAPWTSGAAGDQHPVYMAKTNQRGPLPEEVTTQAHKLLITLGQMMAEEILFVSDHIQRKSSDISFFGAQKVVTCPGQRVAVVNRPSGRCGPSDSSTGLPPCEYKTEDAEPARIRLSLLMIDQIALAGIGGEPLTLIGQHLKKESPFAQTVVLGLANGWSGYIPDDANYDKFTFESTSSHIKRGCAEQSIVNGFLEMMNRN